MKEWCYSVDIFTVKEKGGGRNFSRGTLKYSHRILETGGTSEIELNILPR